MQFISRTQRRLRVVLVASASAAAVALVSSLLIAGQGLADSPTLTGVTAAQLASVGITLTPPTGATPSMLPITKAEAAASLADPGSVLGASVLADVHDSRPGGTNCLCYVINAVPSWGMHTVGGGPAGQCFANQNVLTFNIILVDATTGEALNEIGGNAEPDGAPLPLGAKTPCPTPPGS